MSPKELENKIKIVEEGLQKLLDEQNLDLKVEVQFPQYRILPSRVQLALTILAEEKGKIMRIYSDTSKEVKSNKEKTNL